MQPQGANTKLSSLNYLQISVEDSGVGIDENDYGKLFKLFGFL
jgi:hypothetical protein